LSKFHIQSFAVSLSDKNNPQAQFAPEGGFTANNLLAVLLH